MMTLKPALLLAALTLVLCGGGPAEAGAASQAADPVDTLDEVVVVARRTDAPIWEVSRGNSTVILVGDISEAPREFAWRPEALEAATVRSQRILYPAEGRASISDVLRLLWRIRTVALLPSGTTTADYLSPALQARLDAVMAGERSQRWRTQGLVGLGFDLLKRGGLETRGRGANDVVRRAAKDARIPGEPVGIVRGDELIDSLITAPPATYLPCIAAAISAAEAGEAGAAERLEAWRSRRVPAVLASPLDQALNLCWPAGDPEIAPVLRRQWAEAVGVALDQPGVTLGVAPLRILAEPGGVLDQLQARGLVVEGPAWTID